MVDLCIGAWQVHHRVHRRIPFPSINVLHWHHSFAEVTCECTQCDQNYNLQTMIGLNAKKNSIHCSARENRKVGKKEIITSATGRTRNRTGVAGNFSIRTSIRIRSDNRYTIQPIDGVGYVNKIYVLFVTIKPSPPLPASNFSIHAHCLVLYHVWILLHLVQFTSLRGLAQAYAICLIP